MDCFLPSAIVRPGERRVLWSGTSDLSSFFLSSLYLLSLISTERAVVDFMELQQERLRLDLRETVSVNAHSVHGKLLVTFFFFLSFSV